jgi:cyclase
MFRCGLISLSFALALGAGVLSAQAPQGAPPPGGRQGAPAGPPTLEVLKIADNLYVITGGGGNSTVFVTQNNSVVLVDAKLPGSGAPLLEKIRGITDKPITTLINTHTHADHTGGNVDFPLTVRFMGHENTRANMQKMDQFQGDNAKFIPAQTFRDKLSLFTGTDRIDLYYFGAGGTNGDAWIVIPSLRLMIGGDDVNKGLTLIDAANGGSARGLEQTLTRATSEIKNVDRVVTGHGGVISWKEFEDYAQLTKEFYAWARMQKAAGKTMEQAAMEYKIPDKYAGFNAPNAMFMQRILTVVYNEN